MSNSFSDYPDFMAQDLWVTAPLDQSTHAGVVNNQSLGPWFVAPMPAVALTLPVAAGLGTYVSVTVRQWADAALTQLVATTTYVVPAGRFVRDVIPVQGVYMTILFTGMAGATNIDLILEPCRNLSASALLGNGWEFITGFNRAVGAGATVTVTVPFVAGVRAVWAVSTTCALWSSRLQAFTIGGLAYGSVIGAMDNAFCGSGDSRTVNLPTEAVDWLFTNNDAAAKVFSGSIIPDRIAA